MPAAEISSFLTPKVAVCAVCARCILQMSQPSSIHLHSEQFARKYKGLSLKTGTRRGHETMGEVSFESMAWPGHSAFKQILAKVIKHLAVVQKPGILQFTYTWLVAGRYV